MPHSKKSTEISEMENEKKGSAHALPTILDLNIITDELEEIEKSIKAIQGTIGNTYKGTIRYIANTESEIGKKDMKTWQKGIATLKSNLLTWKEYIGSEACAILESGLSEDKKQLQLNYPLNDEQVTIIADHIRVCAYERLKEIMDVRIIGNSKTQGNIIFDPEKRINNTPDVLKTHWPENKGTIPELLVLIDLINLMIAKIELLSKKTVLSSLSTFGMTIEDIIAF